MWFQHGEAARNDQIYKENNEKKKKKKIATKFGVDELLSPTPLTTPLQLLPTAEKEFEQQKTEQMFPPLLFENFS